jgi:hypothetical protein
MKNQRRKSRALKSPSSTNPRVENHNVVLNINNGPSPTHIFETSPPIYSKPNSRPPGESPVGGGYGLGQYELDTGAPNPDPMAGAAATSNYPQGTDDDIVLQHLCRFLQTLKTLCLPPAPLEGSAAANKDIPTALHDDHLALYKTLQMALQDESCLRGRLINLPDGLNEDSESPEVDIPSLEGFSFVEKTIRTIHPAVPIGIMSTFNQIKIPGIAYELTKRLYHHSTQILGPRDDFTHMVFYLRKMIADGSFTDFKLRVYQVCERMAEQIMLILGPKSLVGMYLLVLSGVSHVMMLDNAGNRISVKVQKIMLKGVLQVRNCYPDNPNLALGFDYFVCSCLYRVELKEQSTLYMIREMVNRARVIWIQGKTDSDKYYGKYYVARGNICLAECLWKQDGRADARATLQEAIKLGIELNGMDHPLMKRNINLLETWCKQDGVEETFVNFRRQFMSPSAEGA